MSADSRMIVVDHQILACAEPELIRDRQHAMAVAAQTASDAANRNWAHSISDARTPSRSSEGSLYAIGEPGHSRSSRIDWSLGLGLIGGLLALVYCSRSKLFEGIETMLLPVLLAGAIGAACGAAIHALVGRVWAASGDDDR